MNELDFVLALSYRIWLATVCLVACLGCGNELVRVEGRVSFDGQPVNQGTIAFEPADGRGAVAGGPIENGAYSLSGESAVAPGVKTVRITGIRKTGRQIEVGPPAPPGMMVDEVERYLPKIYGSESTLTREVVGGQRNQHDFELTSPP